tara:strand:- start:403 stop:1794 length:1392 start_codon:yes stop_codon:yes gene_type:complete
MVDKIMNIRILFYSFLGLHLIMWTAIPFITNNNLPLDTIEALAWGSNLDWGFDKHPPMSAVLVEIFFQIFGSKDWAYYLLSQICIIISFFVVFKLSEEFLKNTLLCLISVLLLEGIYFYNFTTPEFNVNVCLIPFWTLTVFYFWRGLQYNRITDWFLLGVFAGFGFLSKYLFIYLGLAIDFYLVYKILKKEINLKCLVSIIPFLLIIFPHLVWLNENNYITITYGLKRTGVTDQGVLDHIILPIIFLAKQIIILIPFFIMIFFLNQKSKITFNIKDEKLIFLLAINLLPILLIFLTSLVLGAKIRTMWMTPFYIFLGLLSIYVIQSNINLAKLKNFMITFIMLFFLSPFIYGYISITENNKRTDYQGKKIANIVEMEWNKFSKNEFELSSVIGDEWVGGNLSYHIKSRPKRYDLSVNTNELDGGFIIVNHPELNCKSSFYPIFKSVKLDFEGNPCIVMYSNLK